MKSKKRAEKYKMSYQAPQANQVPLKNTTTRTN